MRTAFADEAPVATIKGELVYLTFADDDHPVVTTPIHVLRRFCETSIRTLDEHARKPSNVRPFGGERPEAHD